MLHIGQVYCTSAMTCTVNVVLISSSAAVCIGSVLCVFSWYKNCTVYQRGYQCSRGHGCETVIKIEKWNVSGVSGRV